MKLLKPQLLGTLALNWLLRAIALASATGIKALARQLLQAAGGTQGTPGPPFNGWPHCNRLFWRAIWAFSRLSQL